MKAIIFNTEEEGLARAEEEGRSCGFLFWTGQGNTKYKTVPIPTQDNKWALIVDDYEYLTEDDVVIDDPNILGYTE